MSSESPNTAPFFSAFVYRVHFVLTLCSVTRKKSPPILNSILNSVPFCFHFERVINFEILNASRFFFNEVRFRFLPPAGKGGSGNWKTYPYPEDWGELKGRGMHLSTRSLRVVWDRGSPMGIGHADRPASHPGASPAHPRPRSATPSPSRTDSRSASPPASPSGWRSGCRSESWSMFLCNSPF